MSWGCPHCEHATLPPAVQPNTQRFCVKCGRYFAPSEATQVEHGWVVCAPGDPNERQTDAILSMSGPYRFCMTQWNADTGEVRFEVERPSGTFEYIADTQGETRPLGVKGK